jgi:hypothetical protein
MCFVFIWEQTATCATYIVNWLVIIRDEKCLQRGTDRAFKWSSLRSVFFRLKTVRLFMGGIELKKPKLKSRHSWYSSLQQITPLPYNINDVDTWRRKEFTFISDSYKRVEELIIRTRLEWVSAISF